MYSMNNKNLSVSFSNSRFFVFLKKEMGLRICMRTHPLAYSRHFAPNSLQKEDGCKENEGQGSDGY